MIHVLLQMAGKVDKAASFVSVQLIEQQPGIYDKCSPAWQVKGKGKVVPVLN
jgi:hypothetical protein